LTKPIKAKKIKEKYEVSEAKIKHESTALQRGFPVTEMKGIPMTMNIVAEEEVKVSTDRPVFNEKEFTA
jgi:hypothetical protein